MTLSQSYSLNRQRWATFKSHQQGYFSLWLFMIMLLTSLFAEFIANDKPLLIAYQGNVYSPLFFTYPETTFGGELLTQTNYLDPFIQNNIKKNGWMVWPPVRTSYNTINYGATRPFPSAPSAKHWLGTTDTGLDVFANILYGFRISVFFAFLFALCSALIGVVLGAMQGYYGGKIDLLGQRCSEIWLGMPQFFLIICIASMTATGFWWLLGIMIVFGWITVGNAVRAEFLRARHGDHVNAAKALGVKTGTIILKHILPNAMTATLTYIPFILCGGITMLTALDFIGFGLPLELPSLGRLLVQGKNNMQAPWLGLSAIGMLAILLTLLVFIGDAIRNTFDSRTIRLAL